MKTCSRCEKSKPDEDFFKGRRVCKACLLEQQKAYRAAHSEEVHAAGKRWRKAHVQERQKYNRSLYQEQRDERLEKVHRYYVTHYLEAQKKKPASPLAREAQQAFRANERAARAGAPGRITTGQWRALLQFYAPENVCPSCGKKNGSPVIDYVVPWNMGGPNTAVNAQPLCSTCHREKGNQIADYRPDQGEFARSLANG